MRCGRRPHPRRLESGLTLVELVISIVVIGVAVTGTLLAVSTSVGRSADPMAQQQALAIAEALLEEILSRSFLDPDTATPCPAPEASRDLFDNVCDYHGLDDLGARNQQGTPVAGLAPYRVRVAVDPAATLNGLSGGDVMRVDVRVTFSPGVDITLSSYRTRQ